MSNGYKGDFYIIKDGENFQFHRITLLEKIIRWWKNRTTKWTHIKLTRSPHE